MLLSLLLSSLLQQLLFTASTILGVDGANHCPYHDEIMMMMMKHLYP